MLKFQFIKNKYAHAFSYLLISGATILLGLLREIWVASTFGLSAAFDAYAAIYGFYLFFGNQLPNAFETTLISKYAGGNDTATLQAIVSTSLLHAASAAFLMLLLFLVGRPAISLIFGGHLSISTAFYITLLFIPAVLFSGMTFILRAGLYLKRSYAPGMIYNGVLSLSVIIAVFLLENTLAILSLPLGYAFGGGTMLAIMLLLYRRFYPHQRLRDSISLPAVRNLLAAAFLVMIGECFFQVGFTAERAFAVRISEGSVAAYYYAIAFLTVLITVFITPLNTVLFPRLSEKYNQGTLSLREINRLCLWLGIAGIVFAAILSFAADYVVQLVLVRGQFTAEDARRTSRILAVVVYVMPFMCTGRLLRYCLMAMKDFSCAIWSNALRLSVILLAAPLMISRSGINGLAVVYVAAGIVSVTFLFLRVQHIAKRKLA
jgi:putative peptidoglycan lipid II flippase